MTEDLFSSNPPEPQVTTVVLTEITSCVECGFMQPIGFRDGTPVEDNDNPDVSVETGDSEIPEYVDNHYDVWVSETECPHCGNNYYHKLDLPMPSREHAAVNQQQWYFWGDL